MALFDWFKRLWAPQPARIRNVSTLEGSDVDQTTERIDVDGGPLKPLHLRRAIRDARLLPKPETKINLTFRKRPKVLSLPQATRLFSATQRTLDRQVRDLATDQQQLQRYGLPVWKTEEDLAAALGLTLSQLHHYSIHRQRETSPHYVTFAVRKRSGGHRLIHAPKKRLKAIQRQLVGLLVSKLPVSPHAHGFLSKRSVATNARPHVDKNYVIKMDLKNCFPSIHFGRVRNLLIALGYSYPVATSIAVLCTEAERQPVEAEGKIYHVPVGPRVCVQGAPTSPGFCNAILLRLDRRLAGLARKHGFTYTRYADDLTFSGDDPAAIKRMITLTKRVCREEGFAINRDKTRVMRRRSRQVVTGVTVNKQAGLSRQERRRLRAAIHQLDPNDHNKRRQLAGKVAYLAMLNATQAEPLRKALKGRGEE